MIKPINGALKLFDLQDLIILKNLLLDKEAELKRQRERLVSKSASMEVNQEDQMTVLMLLQKVYHQLDSTK